MERILSDEQLKQPLRLPFTDILCWGFVFFFPAGICLGQPYLSEKGRFQVDFNRGCTPFTVQVVQNEDYGPETPVSYTYERAQGEVSRRTHTYHSPGNFEIVQLTGAILEDKIDRLEITALERVFPDFEFFACNEKEIFIRLPLAPYSNYQVQTEGYSEIHPPGSEVVIRYEHSSPKTIRVEGIIEGASPNCGVTQKLVPLHSFNPALSVLDFHFERVCEGRFNFSMEYSAPLDFLYLIEYSLDSETFIPIFEGPLSGDRLELKGLEARITPGICVRVSARSPCSGQVTVLHQKLCQQDVSQLEGLEYLFSSHSGQGVAPQLYNYAGRPESQVVQG